MAEWSAQDEAEYQRLKGAGNTATVEPSWSEQDEAEYQKLAAVPAGGGDEFGAGMDSKAPEYGAAKGRFMGLSKELLDRLTPVGSVKEIAGQLSGDRPNSALKAGFAAADLASLGLAGKLRAGAGMGELGMQGVKQFLASGAGAGAASMGAEKAGAPWYVQLLAGLTGGVGAGVGAGAALSPKPSVPAAAQALENAGGELTAAMRSPKPGIASSLETSARTNPLLKNKFAGIDEKNFDAVRKIAQEGFGNDVLSPRGDKAGQTLKGILKGLSNKRGEEYAPAVEALANSKSFPRFAANIMKAADSISDVSTVSAQLFKKALATELEGKTTPAQIDKALTHVKSRFQSELAPGSVMDKQVGYDFKSMMNAVKDEYYKGLDNLSSNVPGLKGDLGRLVREAKGDYAEASQAMEPMAKLLASRRGNPEAIGSGLLQSGSENIKALLKQLDPQNGRLLQSELAKSIIGEAMGKEGLSGDKLKTLLNVKYRNVASLLGEESNKLNSLMEAMQTSRMQNLSTVNPSRSGVTLADLGQTTAATGAATAALLGHPMALAPVVGKAGMDAAYTFAGKPIQSAIQAAGRLPKASVAQSALALTRQSEAAEKAKKLSKVR